MWFMGHYWSTTTLTFSCRLTVCWLLPQVKSLAVTTPWRREWQMGAIIYWLFTDYLLLIYWFSVDFPLSYGPFQWKMEYSYWNNHRDFEIDWILVYSDAGIKGLTYSTHALGPIMQWFKGDRIVRVCCEVFIDKWWNILLTIMNCALKIMNCALTMRDVFFYLKWWVLH